jgi:hypothetical protein
MDANGRESGSGRRVFTGERSCSFVVPVVRAGCIGEEGGRANCGRGAGWLRMAGNRRPLSRRALAAAGAGWHALSKKGTCRPASG